MNNLLYDLKNKTLTSVVFILDYLQFQFDSEVLTFLEYPKILLQENKLSFDDIEYQHKMCKLIGSPIINVVFDDNDSFYLIFEDVKICSSLKEEDYTSPEMMIYDNGKGKIISI